MSKLDTLLLIGLFILVGLSGFFFGIYLVLAGGK